MYKLREIIGQWLGHFTYGPEYGELSGEKVTFCILIEPLDDGQFRGTCHELDGLGINDTVATINGYFEDDIIHFTKHYPVSYEFNEDGSLAVTKLKTILTYDGQYHYSTQCFEGTWELEVNLGPSIHGDMIDFTSGTWEMRKSN